MYIVKLSTLQHAERFGTCAECGKGSGDDDLYRIVTETKAGTRTFHSSLCLCEDCMHTLLKQMEEVLTEQDGRDEDKKRSE